MTVVSAADGSDGKNRKNDLVEAGQHLRESEFLIPFVLIAQSVEFPNDKHAAQCRDYPSSRLFTR